MHLFRYGFAFVCFTALMIYPFADSSMAATDSGSCDVTVANGSSIQEAIDSASPNEMVCVAGGTYEEALLITTSGLHLRPAGTDDEVILYGSNSLNTGIVISGTANVTVESISIRRFRDNGVLLQNANGIVIQDNEIDDIGAFNLNNGIRIENTIDVDIEGNRITQISGNNSSGVNMSTATDDVRINNNHFESMQRGVNAFEASNITVTDNTIHDYWSTPFRISSTSNILIDNVEMNGSGSEEMVILNSSDVEMRNSSIQNHFRDGVVVEESNGLVFHNNVFHNHGTQQTSRHALIFKQSQQIEVTDNTFTDSNETGLRIENSSNFTVTGNDLSGHGKDIDIVEANNGIISDNTMERGLVFSGLTASHFDHTVENNELEGGRPVFYANGETNPAIPANAGQVIIFNSADVNVSGLTFEDIITPIQVAYSDGAVISDNTITNFEHIVIANYDSRMYRGMITVWNSEDAVLSSNTITGNNWLSGISILHSDGALADDNEITQSARHGIKVRGSEGVQVSGNTISDSDIWGIYGFEVTDAVISANEVHDSRYTGIFVERSSFSDDTGITGNTLSGNQDGIIVATSQGMLIAGNTLAGNQSSGIHVNYDNEDILVEDNTVADNDGRGIWVSSDRVSGITIHDNTVENSGAEGIVLGSDESEITANTVLGNNGNGIWVNGGDDVLIRENVVTNTVNASAHNYDSGIRVASFTNALLEGNILENNATQGIFIGNSQEVTLTGETVTDSKLHGIVLEESDRVFVGATVASGNRTDLMLLNAEQVTIEDNEFTAGVVIEGDDLVHFQHAFGENTLAGGTVFYADSLETQSIPENASQIILVNSPGIVIENRDLTGVATGIQLAYSPAVTVSNVTVTDNSWNGFSAQYSDHLEFTDNAISGSKGHGIRIENSDTVMVSGSSASGNESVGLYVQMKNGGSGLTATDNVLSNNKVGFEIGQAGFSSGTVEEILFADNRLMNNTEAGIRFMSNAGEATLTGNLISGNGDGLLYNGSFNAPDLDARENWWGHNSGPSGGAQDPISDARATGEGDTVDDDVMFDPWTTLTEEPVALFDITITATNSPVDEMDDLVVQFTVQNNGTIEGMQQLVLENFDEERVDSLEVMLAAGASADTSLVWTTGEGDAGSGEVFVKTENDADSADVTIVDPEAFIIITECMTINQPGNYRLGDDLEDESTCLVITASDVLLDGEGHTITRSSESEDTLTTGLMVGGLQVFPENVKIINLNAGGWHTGIHISRMDNVSLSGVEVTDNAYGLKVSEVTNSSFREVLVTGNGNDLVIADSAAGNSFESFMFGAIATDLAAVDVAISASDPVGMMPEGVDPAGIYVNMEPLSDEAEVEFIHFHYTEDMTEDLAEDDLVVWRYFGEHWSSPHDESYSSGVNTSDMYVFAENITEFSVFGVFSGDVATSVRPEDTPVAFELRQNYPNPFNPATTINYTLPEASPVRLTVYDLLGQRVTVLVDEQQSAGHYDISFNGTMLPSGVYIYRIRAGSFVETRKMILVK